MVRKAKARALLFGFVPEVAALVNAKTQMRNGANRTTVFHNQHYKPENLSCKPLARKKRPPGSRERTQAAAKGPDNKIKAGKPNIPDVILAPGSREDPRPALLARPGEAVRIRSFPAQPDAF
jgi:hypothetical protein